MINVEELKVGDKVWLPVYPLSNIMEGTVIAVNREKRYFRVSFITEEGKELIECFPTIGPMIP